MVLKPDHIRDVDLFVRIYAGKAGVDGVPEQGRIDCPSPSSAGNPCTLTIWVNLADVGNPAPGSLLEEVSS